MMTTAPIPATSAVSSAARHIGTITKTYSMPDWFDDTAVLVAATAECFGAVLFWRAVVRFRGNGTGLREAWWALIPDERARHAR
jgi:hypothetical protein